MKYRIYLIALALVMAHTTNAQILHSIDSEGLEILLNRENDTTYVVNFWATWCSPCIKEIPYFKTLQSTYHNSNLRVLLINLDFPNQVESRVIPFLEEYCEGLTVYHMTDIDYNKWIPMVSDEWSGAIPATLVFKGKNRVFIGSEVKLEQLERIVEQIKVE